jgi:hypothetical protein
MVGGGPLLSPVGEWRPYSSTSILHSHAPPIRSQRGTSVVLPDFHPMRVSEETVCINLFWQNPVFTSLHLRSPIHVVPSQEFINTVMVGSGCHIIFLKNCYFFRFAVLCVFLFSHLCVSSEECHVHSIYVCTTEFIN